MEEAILLEAERDLVKYPFNTPFNTPFNWNKKVDANRITAVEVEEWKYFFVFFLTSLFPCEASFCPQNAPR